MNELQRTHIRSFYAYINKLYVSEKARQLKSKKKKRKEIRYYTFIFNVIFVEVFRSFVLFCSWCCCWLFATQFYSFINRFVSLSNTLCGVASHFIGTAVATVVVVVIVVFVIEFLAPISVYMLLISAGQALSNIRICRLRRRRRGIGSSCYLKKYI